MADTLTLQIDEKIATALRREARETGETVEAVALRLLEDAAIASPSTGTGSLLSPDQQADLDQRLIDPGPLATDAEVETFFNRFAAS